MLTFSLQELNFVEEEDNLSCTIESDDELEMEMLKVGVFLKYCIQKSLKYFMEIFGCLN